MARSARWKWLVGLALGVTVALALVIIVRFTQRLPSGPVLIVWDREACAECHMHVGEPRFAAQLQTKDGAVWNFDDPGCLLHYLATRKPDVHAMYFRHLREDRWLSRGVVGFIAVEATSMGYNLGVVESGAPGALSFDAAQARIEARPQRGAE